MNAKPTVIERALALLRQFGWEAGHQQLEAGLRADGEPAEGRQVAEVFLGWIAAEHGKYAEAIPRFEAVREVPALAGWGLAGQGFVAMREKNFLLALQHLQAAREIAGGEPQLLATLCHVEGAARFHQGDSDRARPLLIEAMRVYGPEHFAVGRVLDTLGMIYASRDNFQGAREFFERALTLKRDDDWSGLAVTHGQLGRLYLDWGYLEKAQRHFEEDLKICRQIGDEFGKAVMYNFLGQVCLARGEQAAATNRAAGMLAEWDAAAGWLEAAATLSLEKKWPITEAFAQKDRARVALARGDVAAAEAHARIAEDIFSARGFDEGLAHVRRVLGMIRVRQGRFEEAHAALRVARRHFEAAGEAAEVARTLFAVAQASAASNEPRPVVTHALLEALAAAESCRRAQLVRQVEEELKLSDAASYCNCVYRRVRGRAITEDAVSLIDGTRDSATVLFLDLQGSTEFARFRDPGETLMTLNEMMAHLATVLRKHEAHVTGFRGDGFMALLRGPHNAARGVEAAIDLHAAMAVFNEPRAVLGLPPFVARIGVSSGDVFVGNVGTYDKLDFTAVGHSVNLAARLEGTAEPGFPCVSRATFEKVQQRFRFTPASPRTVELKGLGPTQMWDVAGRVTPAPASPPAPPPAPVQTRPITVEELYSILAPQIGLPKLLSLDTEARRDAVRHAAKLLAEFRAIDNDADNDAASDGESDVENDVDAGIGQEADFIPAGSPGARVLRIDDAGEATPPGQPRAAGEVRINLSRFAAWVATEPRRGAWIASIGRTGADARRFVFRRLNPSVWEFAFGSARTTVVGKHLVGFLYVAALLSEADRELRPGDLLNHNGGAKRAAATDANSDGSRIGQDPSREADRTLGNDDRLDDRATAEYRDRVRELQHQLAVKEDPAERRELEFIEAQLRASTRPGGKRVVEGANRLKRDYNALKKAIDTALGVLQDHKQVDLAVHLSAHLELSAKGCRYRNSARLEWDLTPAR